jgi:hypothetical protein
MEAGSLSTARRPGWRSEVDYTPLPGGYVIYWAKSNYLNFSDNNPFGALGLMCKRVEKPRAAMPLLGATLFE